MFTRIVVVAVCLAGWTFSPAAAVAEHWSQGVSTHATGPTDLVDKPGVIGQMINGTSRVVRAGFGVVKTGVTLPFKLTAGAVRALRSDRSQETIAKRSSADSSAGFASILAPGASPKPATVTEWMRQPRPE